MSRLWTPPLASWRDGGRLGASGVRGPLLLVMLGSRSLGSRLVALAPYQPYFVAAALGFFSIAFHRLTADPSLSPDDACAVPAAQATARRLLGGRRPGGMLMAFRCTHLCST